jgi:hypothetical protein
MNFDSLIFDSLGLTMFCNIGYLFCRHENLVPRVRRH